MERMYDNKQIQMLIDSNKPTREHGLCGYGHRRTYRHTHGYQGQVKSLIRIQVGLCYISLLLQFSSYTQLSIRVIHAA
jgi:hypothetical protein